VTTEKNPVNDKYAKDPTGLSHIFRALRYRNYRLFFIGQGISLIGTWMQSVAMSWLVYSLTNSALLLGVVAFSGLICTFLFSPFAGVLSDRMDRKRIVLITQVLSMIQALTLAAVVLTGSAAVWNLIILSAALGLINAFDMPARQSFIPELVENRADLGNAIALNSSLFNSARLIGPSIAGILVALVGEGICFLINGLSFIAVLACLLSMRILPREVTATHDDLFSGMKEGLAYAFGFAPIRYTIMLLSLAALVGMPYAVLMPVFAREILQGGANTLGFLMAAAGGGALAGAIYLASRKSPRGLVKIIIAASLVFGAGLVLFSFSRVLSLSLLFMGITGFGMVTQMAASNTLIQLIADDNMRGRIMSLYVMAFMGLAPFGSLLFGWLASIIGAPFTLMAGGLCCMAGGLVFAGRFKSVKGQVQKAFIGKGLISE
jgi:MFS family permease